MVAEIPQRLLIICAIPLSVTASESLGATKPGLPSSSQVEKELLWTVATSLSQSDTPTNGTESQIFLVLGQVDLNGVT